MRAPGRSQARIVPERGSAEDRAVRAPGRSQARIVPERGSAEDRPVRAPDPDLPAELELRLSLPRTHAAALLAHPAVVALARGPARTQRLAAVYFDTDDRRLAAGGLGLRLRREGRRWVQTLKGPADERSGGGLAARPEFELDRGGAPRRPALDPTQFASTPWRSKLAKAHRRGLRPVFETAIDRTTLALAFDDGTRVELALDRGRIAARGHGTLPVCDVELELVAGSVASLFALAMTLAQDLPVALEVATKAARGYALADGLAPVPVRARDADLARSMTPGAALAAIGRSCLRQIEGNAAGVGRDDDPEWIHQLRVGTRRLRACLALCRHHGDDARLAALAADARWLAGALGPARDLDVLARETLPGFAAGQRTGGGGPIPGWRSLVARVAVRRRAARVDARAAVASPRFVRFLLAAGAVFAAPLPATVVANETAEAADATEVAPGSTAGARAFAAALLKRRHRKLLAQGGGLPDLAPEARHRLRLAAKKLRYATEFFAPLFPVRRVRRYRRALAVLQDELGALNDAAVAAQRIAALAGPESPVAAALAGWAGAQATLRRATLARAWQDFAATRPFWRRD